MRSLALFLLKLGFTCLCLWWVFAQVDVANSVFARPGAVDYRWLAGGTALAGLAVALNAVRWWIFIRAQELCVPVRRAIELTMVGNLFSLVSVGGVAGDAARVLLLIRDHPSRKLVATMSVLVDHLAGMVSLALLFFAVSVARFEALVDQSVLGRGVMTFSWFFMGGGLALIVLISVCASPPMHRRIHANGRFDRWPTLNRLPGIYDIYRRKWPLGLAGVAISVLMLLVYFASFWCGLRAVGGTADAGAVITAMPVIDAVSGLPVTVAGLGVREKLFEVLLGDLVGESAETAVAASLAGFACNTLWALLGAVFFLKKRDRVKLVELEQAKEF
jgi:uncharacterized membrane protein YbhN (UPF0104 family)